MRTYHRISKPGLEPTRLDLPETDYARIALKRLRDLGYVVELTDEPSTFDVRGPLEMARMHALLDLVI